MHAQDSYPATKNTMKQHLLASLLLHIFLFSAVFITACHDQEREALLSFKSLVEDPSNRLSSWQGKNCCDWVGITCSYSKQVISIDLPNPNPEKFVVNRNGRYLPTSASSSTALSGRISPSIFSLSQLDYLDLSFNNFMSSSIPDGFWNLTQLTYLNLSNAMLSGSVSTQFANLTSLITLDISCSVFIPNNADVSFNLSSSRYFFLTSPYTNMDNGHISASNLDWLGGLRNLNVLGLTGLGLSRASQSKKWAKPISQLSNLRTLSMSNCKITGDVPINEFLNLTRLESLSMNFNFFNSSIPSRFANMTSLSILALTHNYIRGSVPYIPHLQELYIGENPDLEIDLHSMFSVPWGRLEVLDILLTPVLGTIPDSLTNTTSLTRFRAGGCGLQGSIPPSISNLSRLISLSLKLNNLTGNLPQSLSYMRSLTYLSLSENSIEGSIPRSICDISTLQYLLLEANELTGNAPDCIGQMYNLVGFRIDENHLNGTVASFQYLFRNSSPNIRKIAITGLTVKIENSSFPVTFQPLFLKLRSCDLEGEIPRFISHLTELSDLDLSHNNLSGTIPSWLFKLPKLSFLDLSFNNFQGTLPPAINMKSSFYMTELVLAGNNLSGLVPRLSQTVEVVDLSNNSFTGKVPAYMGTLRNLRYLSLSGNKLSGPIPLSFCQAGNVLMHLDLSNNTLSGRIPSSTRNCSLLRSLNLGSNRLEGYIPDELRGSHKLIYLRLQDNRFRGSFPSSVLQLQSLEVLNLAKNNLKGQIPRSLGDLRHLRILSITGNLFEGSIPNEIIKLERLQIMDFSNNSFTGPIPKKLGGLKTLLSRPKDRSVLANLISYMTSSVELSIVIKGSSNTIKNVFSDFSMIDLSRNALTGKVPSEIGLLQGLYSLDLSHNSLSGQIPTSIGEMRGLESLDLSFNHLNGQIPQAMATLDFLSYLNLSYNNLSGKVPKEDHFDTLGGDGSAYIGNLLLCDVPWGIKCGANDENDNDDKGNDSSTAILDKFKFHEILLMGYGVGFAGFCVCICLMKVGWRNKYWTIINNIALAISLFMCKQ